MKKLIIFDLDGTLLFTGLDIQNTLNETLTHFNLPTLSLKETLRYVGNGARRLVECAIKGDARLDEISKYYLDAFSKTDNDLTMLYEGEEAVLRKFIGEGRTLAILTNKPQTATENVVKRFLGDIDFKYIIGQSNMPLKPDPTACEYIIKSCGVTKAETVLIGDGEADVLTAKNADIDCVSALWGYRTKEELEMVGATTFAENFLDLTKKL